MLLNDRSLTISSRRMRGVQRTARTSDALQMVGQFEKQTRSLNSAGGTKMFAISRLSKPHRRHRGTAWFSENAAWCTPLRIMIKISNTTAIAFAGAILFAIAQPALGQVDDSKLGKVHFETSCKPEAQKLFDRAMLYQHSFWYRASQKVFEDVLKADPECGIAYWGIALSVLLNPHVAPPAKNLAEGAAAIAKGQNVGAKTQRERDYIDALAVMYADYAKVDHRTRIQAYAKAMEQLAQRYPNDDEAQIHYALSLNTSASPADKTYANQLKGAAILEPIFARQPQHPGVAHYLIHLYDYPPIAEKGLNAARLYAKIAPDAAHAQHMPSHIFTRVGYWQESIDSNVVSKRVAKEAGDFHDQLHAMDYLVYAYLQLGKDTNAKAVIDDMMTVTGFTETFLPVQSC
jgi:hypothetical protein